jgi:hypothetical protein
MHKTSCSVFFFFCGAGEQTQGLMHARQHTPNPLESTLEKEVPLGYLIWDKDKETEIQRG